MVENNAVCAICGKEYYLCLGCKSFMAASPWKIHTDTSEHYKIYQILKGNTSGVYNKDEAKEKLESVDLSDLDSFNTTVRNHIVSIMNTDDKAEKPKKATRKKKSTK